MDWTLGLAIWGALISTILFCYKIRDLSKRRRVKAELLRYGPNYWDWEITLWTDGGDPIYITYYIYKCTKRGKEKKEFGPLNGYPANIIISPGSRGTIKIDHDNKIGTYLNSDWLVSLHVWRIGKNRPQKIIIE